MRRESFGKRLLSMLLALVMIVGVLPAAVFAADETVLDAAIFCSDLHGSTSELSSVLSAIGTNINASAIGFNGDTCVNEADLESLVKEKLSDTSIEDVYSYAESHDADDGGDIYKNWDYSGKCFENDNYIIYTIRETDMISDTGADEAFTTWYSRLTAAQKAKPIFILSHRPLHDRRNDNAGAAGWYTAISAAANTSDIVFFWAHNHTGETSVDTNAYYVPNDGSETITVEGGSTVGLNFTYMNAGYMNANGQNPKRKPVATTVQITASSLIFQDYTTGGTYTDSSYSHNVTVTRKFASTTVSEQTFASEDLVALVTATATGATIENVAGEVSVMDSLVDNYCAYSVALEGYVEDTDITIHLALPEDVSYTNVVLYRVNSDGTYTEITDDQYDIALDSDGFYNLVFAEEYDSLGTYVYGTPIVQIPDGAELTKLTVVNKGPTKYFKGENSTEVLPLNITGLTVTATYSNGTDSVDKIIPWNEFGKITDGYSLTFDMTVLGDQDVVVTYIYEGVTLTDTYSIWIGEESFSNSNITVTTENPGATGVTIEDLSTADNVSAAVGGLLESGYVAYDIVLSYLDDKGLDGGNATVKMPAPDGANVVYYFNDTTGALEKMEDATFADGYVTFTTNHFSIYVVGETTEADEETLTLGSDKTKTVYVLVSTPTAGNQYIIVSSGSAGSAYALKENTTTGTSVTINAASGNITAPYIETSDTTIMWNATSGLRFQSENGGYYLRYNSGLAFSTTNSTNWTAGTNTLTCTSNSRTYYLYYDNGWTTSRRTQGNLYFYEKQTITVSGKTEYSVSGTDIEHVYSYTVDSEGNTTTTVDLTKTETIAAVVNGNGTALTADELTALGGTWSYALVSDSNDIIDETNSDGSTLVFTGKTGTALVRAYYTFTVDGTEYKIWDTITVTATYPYYTVDITHNSDGTGAEGTTSEYVSVEDTIIIKGETEIKAGYDLWAKVYLNGTGDPITVSSDSLNWISNNPSVAEVDDDGNVTFTGKDGSAQITVYYEYIDNTGNKVQATDVVTFSVTVNPYIVPGDGTDDFPEYPNQGAVRFDKTATAVGNFSQTGIAQVELSMTGVPYGTSAKTDVVIMVDMTASMSDDDVTAAELAVQELIENLVYDEENDKYDSNIQLFVDVFYSASTDDAFETEEYLNCVTISNADELTAAKNKISFTQSSSGGGTRYNLAMADVYATLTRDGHADNQFVVFVSDGVPTAYAPATTDSNGNVTQGTTLTGSNSTTESLADGWFDLDTGAVTSTFKTEYYSYMIKTAGIPIYTVGCNLTALTEPALVLDHMSSNYSPDGKTSTGETKYSFFCTTSNGITDEVLAIFAGIGQDIKEAATNVVVEDKIADEYTVTFSLPAGVTSDEAGMSDFYIQAVGYTLNETTNEREGNPEVLEKFLFNSDGTITHTIGSTTCGDTCSHVTYTNGVVTKIDGTYFDYESTNDGEFLHWYADKLDRTELALQYFVYLDNSAGDVAADKQVDGGTYDTNEYATITYTNFKGTEVQQKFPVPSMTWKGAQVTYVFYLVNEQGQPVNRAGKVIPFAEAIYVTEPVTYDVTWNEETGSENMLAHDLFAYANVPSVYKLYDESAYYEIRVYQTEGVDQSNNAKNYNYFVISGSDSGIASQTTTKVFNTKAGNRYEAYGVYSAQAKGSTLYTSDINGDVSTVTVDYQTTDIDYANTTVAFAVVWKPELVEDTVVIDFGLDVVIDVYTNDGLAAGVTGVSLTAPISSNETIAINKGTYADAYKVGSDSVTSNDGIWTASVESLTSVRFHMNSMGISAPAMFYYEAGVNYYTYDSNNNATLNTTNMYSSVTVIPATTVYYEDSFVDYEVYTKESGSWELDEDTNWAVDGTTSSATQDVDRPGVSQAMSDVYDANNLYGYDSAYTECSKHSLGSAAYVTVDANTYGTATFTFYGTGFDVVSLTSNNTGLITVKIYAGASATGTSVKNLTVDTYYGYTKDADGNWVVDKDAENALYQIPVISYEGLRYGQYTVVIKCAYNTALDHQGDGSYKFYLDAIRVYNPCGIDEVVDDNGTTDDTSDDVTVGDIYEKDGEGWPVYEELRGNVLAASDITADSAQINGVVFIDGIKETASYTDYLSYGPNNELYLGAGQAIVFNLDLSSYGDKVQSVQIGMKSADGNEVSYVIADASKVTEKTDLTEASTTTLSTATDMYYDVTSLKDATIVVYNAGETGILSLTNIKVTFSEEVDAAETALCYVSGDTVAAVIQSMNTDTPAVTVQTSASDVEVGDTIIVTVTTSKNVSAVSVNGTIVNTYIVSGDNYVWTAEITASTAGEQQIDVTAYDQFGNAYKQDVQTVTVSKPSTADTVKEIVKTIISKLKSWFSWK